jgi:hypothetical protein
VLVLVALLLLTASGDTNAARIVFEGEQVAAGGDAVIVAGGTVTVPANASVSETMYVVGGRVEVEGRIDRVVFLAGDLAVRDGATVGGLQVTGDAPVVEPGASIGHREDLTVTDGASGIDRLVTLLVQTGLSAAIAVLVVRRRPALFQHTGDAVVEHPLVCLVVGSLTSLTLLALFVFMAFTVVLVPLSLFGLVAFLLSVEYATVVLGAAVGRRLPFDTHARRVVGGVALVSVALWALGSVAMLGLVAMLGVATGLGAIFVTYYGFAPFEPVELPG